MKRRRRNKFKYHPLTATENVLKLDDSQLQYVRIPMTNAAKWNFGTGDFCISFLTALDTLNAPVWMQIYSTNDGGQVIFSYDAIGSFALTSNQGTVYTIPSNFSQLIYPNRLYRLTIMRRGNIVEGWLNNHKLGEVAINPTDNFNLFSPGNYVHIGTRRFLQDRYVKGVIGNFIVIKGKALNIQEMQCLHETNTLPVSAHAFCTAHYLFNHSNGDKAFDAIEQYNYSKATILTPNHGDLINYSNQEIGSDNSLEQTAWQNLYTKAKGKSFLRFNGINGYGEVQNFTDQPLGTDWAIAFEASPPVSVPAEDYYSIFSTVGIPFGNGVYNHIYAWWRWLASAGDSLTEGRLVIGIYHKNGATINPGSDTLPNIPRWKINYPFQRKYIVLIYSKFNPLVDAQGYSVWVDGKEVLAYNPVFAIDNFFLKGFYFANDSNVASRFGRGGIGKFVVYSGSINEDVLNRLNGISESLEYKKLPGIKIDIDCGSVFKIGPNYYCKDNSGNNRDLRLINWNVKTDQPYSVEQNTGIPLRRKALRLLRSSGHHLTVPNFNPTKEKGYTYIIGFKSNVQTFNSPFGACLLSKRSNSSQEFKGIFCNPGLASIGITQKREGFSQEVDVTIDYKDARNLCFFSATEPGVSFGTVNAFANGFPVQSGQQNIIGFDEIDNNQDLRIGVYDSPGQNSFDGHLVFVGIWKGILDSKTILDIVNGTLSQKSISEIMEDCQLYLTFDEILNDAGVFKIKDWSPLDRTVILNNFSLAEITPTNALYKIADIDQIRDNNILFPDVALPASIQSKTFLWYDTNFRKYLDIGAKGTVMALLDKNGNASKTSTNNLFATNGLHYRRFKNTRHFLASHVLINDPNVAHTEFNMASKNMDFMHNGSEWFAAIVFGHKAHDSTPYTMNLFSTGSNNNNINSCDIQVPSGNDLIQVLISSDAGTFGNVLFYQGILTRDNIHLIIFNYDPALPSDNLSMYLDGSTVPVSALPGSSRNRVAVHDPGVSAFTPQFYQRQIDGNKNEQWCGEMIFGNQKLGLTELDDLRAYFMNKYAIFPKPI